MSMITKQRNKEISSLYKKGKTLQEIGNIFSITRSRAQQIVFREFKGEIFEKTDKETANMVHKKIHSISKNRMRITGEKLKKISREKFGQKMKLAPHYSKFFTLKGYAAALGVYPPTIRYYFPDIAAKIVNRKKTRWSIYFEKCQICGTVKSRHVGKGLCKDCYQRKLRKKMKKVLKK